MHQPNYAQFATTTQLATGPRLHYAEQGDPTGEAIIFLHGYSDSWFSFSPVLPLLHAVSCAFAASHAPAALASLSPAPRPLARRRRRGRSTRPAPPGRAGATPPP
jgi:pimeloyl-ACP methyl ester carboxylesterase